MGGQQPTLEWKNPSLYLFLKPGRLAIDKKEGLLLHSGFRV